LNFFRRPGGSNRDLHRRSRSAKPAGAGGISSVGANGIRPINLIFVCVGANGIRPINLKVVQAKACFPALGRNYQPNTQVI